MPASIWENEGTPIVGGNNFLRSQRFVATEGQTLFTLTNFNYTVGTGSLLVFVNGVLQSVNTDFTETSAGSFTVPGLEVGDTVAAFGVDITSTMIPVPITNPYLLINTLTGALPTASGQDAIALGLNASAASNFGIAIGESATVSSSTGGIAVGSAATATGYGAVSIGINSDAVAESTVAIGRDAHANTTHTKSTAIGAFSSTTKANQVVLGTATEEVFVPGTLVVSESVKVIGATDGIGYGVGAGGSVTQLTSKITAVTLNKPCGRIIMNNASMAAGETREFVLVNSLITGNDLLVCHASGFADYLVNAKHTTTGQAGIRVTNTSASVLSDALLLNFAIIKGATS